MDSDGTFNWPDGDIILRVTHGPDRRDFQVHKLLLSLTSPFFRDMFTLPQNSPPTSTASVIDMTDPLRAMEVILRLIYHAVDLPAINDLTLLWEVLTVAEKYDFAIVRSRFRQSLVEFANSDPLRVYAIAYRLGYEDEMKIASSRSTSIHFPGLTKLPEEFGSIPTNEYHRLILLHQRYRKRVEAIVLAVNTVPFENPTSKLTDLDEPQSSLDVEPYDRGRLAESIRRGTPLDYKSLLSAMANFGFDVERRVIKNLVLYVLDKAKELNLTV